MQNLNRDDRREMRRQMVNSLVLLLVVLGLAAVCAVHDNWDSEVISVWRRNQDAQEQTP